MPVARAGTATEPDLVPILLPPQRGLHARIQPQLVQHVGDVRLHGRDLHEHLRGDLLVRQPLRQKDRKSTRLNSSHVAISYAVFCLKKKIVGSSTTHYSSLIQYH